MGVDDPLEMQRLGEQLPIERAASRFIVSDDPEEHIERIAWYIGLGFRHLVFHDPGADQADFLRALRRRDPPAPAGAVRVTVADRSGWTVVLPVKNAARAKSRLAGLHRRRPRARPRHRARHDRGRRGVRGGGAGRRGDG